ncbi:MAG: ATP-binding cassette domain-containing protein [Phycisphaerales bacterium]|nr:ATP-binding cassette domain-containing protein [Phycisphaerales bacterium]
MEHAVVIENLRKTFGDKVAVEGLDLRVQSGSLTGLIGPNGAGKSTTIRMLMSILFPDSGTLSVLGKRSALESKDRIGYLPEERGVYRKMKVTHFLKYMGKLKGLRDPELGQRVAHWLDRVQLSDAAGKRCEELSKGMQQKVQFIAAVLHEPELLILDEPFSGLDPVNLRLLQQLMVEQHEQGRTVILCTHVMFQAEQMCESIVMINNGQKVLDATIEEIRANHEPSVVLFDPIDGENPQSARDIDGISSVEQTREGWAAHIDPQAIAAPDAVREIAQAIRVRSVAAKRVTLEDVFVEQVAGGSADREAEVRDSLRASVDESESMEGATA